jgi:hypothetical protein
MTVITPPSDTLWIQVPDAYPPAAALYDAHYSSRTRLRAARKTKKFTGPGEYIALMTPTLDALFVWRKFRSMRPNEHGINCAVFRNESTTLSSTLILDAVRWARTKWPPQRLYTYVSPRHIRSTNPGACFKKAGWTYCGKTLTGLHILQLLPTSASCSAGAAAGRQGGCNGQQTTARSPRTGHAPTPIDATGTPQ